MSCLMQTIQNILQIKHYFTDWEFNLTLAGAVVSITGCAAAIFSCAPFFTICFGFLTGICLFAAMQIQLVGNLKKTEEMLNGNVTRLETQLHTLGEELNTANSRGVKMSAQIAAYERTFEENKTALDQLHQAMQSNLRQENQQHQENNAALSALLERMKSSTLELMEKAQKFSATLKDESKIQFEEMRQLLRDFTKPGSTVEKLKELQFLQEQRGQLTGSIRILNDLIKEMEEKLVRLQDQAERYTHENDRLRDTTDKLQKIVIEKQNPFPEIPNESRMLT